jgi:hypothetical protein
LPVSLYVMCVFSYCYWIYKVLATDFFDYLLSYVFVKQYVYDPLKMDVQCGWIHELQVTHRNMKCFQKLRS